MQIVCACFSEMAIAVEDVGSPAICTEQWYQRATLLPAVSHCSHLGSYGFGRYFHIFHNNPQLLGFHVQMLLESLFTGYS